MGFAECSNLYSQGGKKMPKKSIKCMFFSGINLDFVIKAQALEFHR